LLQRQWQCTAEQLLCSSGQATRVCTRTARAIYAQGYHCHTESLTSPLLWHAHTCTTIGHAHRWLAIHCRSTCASKTTTCAAAFQCKLGSHTQIGQGAWPTAAECPSKKWAGGLDALIQTAQAQMPAHAKRTHISHWLPCMKSGMYTRAERNLSGMGRHLHTGQKRLLGSSRARKRAVRPQLQWTWAAASCSCSAPLPRRTLRRAITHL